MSFGGPVKKFIVLASLFSWPLFASAESTTFSCDSEKSTVVFVIENLTSVEDIESSIPAKATATLLAVRMPHLRGGTRIPLSGSRKPSAKGAYYELYSETGIELLLAAPASKSYDELKIDGVKPLEIICNK